MLEKPNVGDPCNGCGLCCKAQVCSAGSFTLRLVEEYGERADGPCPALITEDHGGYSCGVIQRPKDYAPGAGSAHDLRAAFGVMIGAGAGCDEPGDGPEDDILIERLAMRFEQKHGREGILRAVQKWWGVK